MGLKIKHIMEGNGSGNDWQASLVGLKCQKQIGLIQKKNSLTNFNIEFNFKSQTGFASDSINSLLHENSL